MKKLKDIITRLLNKNEVLLTVLLAIMVFVFSLINPNFIKSYNLLSMSQSLVPYAILTLGILFVIATGNTDLSLGSVCIASCAIAGKCCMMGMNIGLAIPVMIAVSLIFGAINGYLIAYKGIPSFIATLGTMMFSRGISAIIVVDPNLFFPTGTWYNKLFSNYNGFPTGLIWLLVLIIITSIVIRKTKIGRYILAIGSNLEATRLSGVNTKLYIFLSFLISGFSAGIAGVFWSASFATIAAATGNGMEFDAMAAAFIGGTSAAGGSVKVLGSMIGMVMLTVIRSGLNFTLSRFDINVNSTYVTYAVTGLIIIASILIDISNKNRKSGNKKKSNRNKIIAIILAIAIAIAGIAYSTSENKENKYIAVISKGETAPFWVSVRQGCMQAGEDYGYEVSFRGPENESASSLPQALSLAKTQISNNPVAIGMASICEGFTDILVEAYKNNIPVIQYDSGVYGADIEAVDKLNQNPIISNIATNNYEASALGARHAYEMLYDEIVNHEGTFLVTAIQYNQSVPAHARVSGFVEEFKKLADEDPQTRGKVDTYIEMKPDETNNNYKAALESLTERGANVVFLTTTIVAEQALDAILASNGRYDDIYFVGFDVGTKQLEWIKDDSLPKMLGGVVQDSYNMGYMVVENAIKASKGEPIEESIEVEGIWYDATNEDELLEQGVLYEG